MWQIRVWLLHRPHHQNWHRVWLLPWRGMWIVLWQAEALLRALRRRDTEAMTPVRAANGHLHRHVSLGISSMLVLWTQRLQHGMQAAPEGVVSSPARSPLL